MDMKSAAATLPRVMYAVAAAMLAFRVVVALVWLIRRASDRIRA
jgi:hypothetical protein